MLAASKDFLLDSASRQGSAGVHTSLGPCLPVVLGKCRTTRLRSLCNLSCRSSISHFLSHSHGYSQLPTKLIATLTSTLTLHYQLASRRMYPRPIRFRHYCDTGASAQKWTNAQTAVLLLATANGTDLPKLQKLLNLMYPNTTRSQVAVRAHIRRWKKTHAWRRTDLDWKWSGADVIHWMGDEEVLGDVYERLGHLDDSCLAANKAIADRVEIDPQLIDEMRSQIELAQGKKRGQHDGRSS